MTLAHQHLSQLADEDQSGYLYHSVMADARTKIVFGGLDAQDLQAFAENMLLHHFSPWAVKHIQRTPVFCPVESRREVPTRSTSVAESQNTTGSYSEADSISHSRQHSITHGRSVADSFAETEGESDTYTQGRNSSITESQNWGRSETQSGAHTTGTSLSTTHSHGHTNSDGTTDSVSSSAASGRSQGEGRQSATSSGEGQSMLPAREGLLFTADPAVVGISTHTGATEGQSSFAGMSDTTGTSTGHAHNRVHGESEMDTEGRSLSSTDTEGWSNGWNEGYGVARTDGASKAWAHGTNRSTARGTSVTKSESTTDGYSDTTGKTSTHGEAYTQGKTSTHGESVTLSPFYEYKREEIETPTFLMPEEQKLLVMQKLARIPKQHFLVKAPESSDCVVQAPYVPDPVISLKRLAVGLESVYNALPCYTRREQHDEDIIDVEVRAVHKPQRAHTLPSPTPTDEPLFWQPAQEKGRQEKS